MVPLFGKAPPQFIFNQTMYFVVAKWGNLLQTFNQGWLSRPCLLTFCESIYKKEGGFDDVWGFLDGTICPVYRPKL